MAHSNGGPEPTTIGNAQAELNGAMNAMKDNIVMLAERGETLDSLKDKSAVMHGSASRFRQQAKSLSLEMQWQQRRVLVGVGLLLLWLLVVAAFYFSKKARWWWYLIATAFVPAMYFVTRLCCLRRYRRLQEEENSLDPVGPPGE
eukprot:gnl/TRDRNA2_/TRDRNA2_186553_c0_seq1.p1 gnl/TRDRNA2_/TRDRNA2_186553_c0~~gnl/TRDRNA2_/TRDRNA2_186553_c0_seq1.p1  ORF type:complete len:145 (-),score=19.69 gnl/TRDRNA2_/TRDRNA2_186553_c0_seq1:111-545(-)